MLTGQAQPHVVFGKQDVRHALPEIGLVLPYPYQLGRGEPSKGVVAGDGDQTLPTDDLTDQVALGRGALIVPEDRWAKDLISSVEKHRAVHLAGQPNRDHRIGRHPWRGEHLAD